METLIKLNNQTAGRDKIARLFQYLSRVLWHKLQQRSNKDSASGIKNFEYQLSTFRKLLRFGKSLDVLYSTLQAFQCPDSTVRVSLILSKISGSLFLLADHIVWLGRADLCNVDSEKWCSISNKYWLYSVTLNLVRDVYEIALILKSQKTHILPDESLGSLSDVLKALLNVLLCLRRHKSVMIDTVKNACDFFIPLTALGHVKLSPGTVGWLGVVSSAAGLIVLMEPLLKLSPA